MQSNVASTAWSRRLWSKRSIPGHETQNMDGIVVNGSVEESKFSCVLTLPRELQSGNPLVYKQQLR